ncbi:MAPEG family protein [Luteimonas qiangzhengi]|uniref:MAPEG family protein n=1 Tax=Luteimonas sp. MJ146 TaxID=3129240 RepID=UPI0031BA3E84
MPVEIQMLAWSILLGVAQLFLAAALMTRQRGLKWNASARDGDPEPLTGVAGRADRAMHNFLETFPFFAAAALAVVATGSGDAITALGAQLWFWARVVYVPLYLAGIPYVRSMVWALALLGMLMVLSGLL